MLIFIIVINSIVITAVWFSSAKFFNNKKPSYENFLELDKLFSISKSNLSYLSLSKSNVNSQIKKLYKKMKKPMFADKILLDNKEYLKALSQFVDYKINKCNQTFRAKSNIILIDQIAYILSMQIFKNCRCDLFFQFKLAIQKYSLRQKEIKTFKILLAKHLFNGIIKTEDELNQISKAIQKSKNAKYLKKYSKMILNSANVYGIYKYNKSSNKILYNFNGNKFNIIKELFIELIEAEYRLKLAVNYLKVLFN